jgi:branched-chain amino acid transport system substrate-binding protein
VEEPYLDQVKVPEIGSNGPWPWFNTDPDYFPQISSGANTAASWVLAWSKALTAGPRKVALLYCAEVAACTQVGADLAKAAQAAGLDPVGSMSASTSAPDYTAQCLKMQSQGAQTLMPIVNPATVQRLAASCATQGYHPVLALQSSTWKLSDLGLPGFSDAVIASTAFPYTLSNTPARAEFQAAAKQFGSGMQIDLGTAMAWTSAKLLQKGLENAGPTITSATLIAGLDMIKNDTLGGLTAPLTFAAGQPANVPTCTWYAIQQGSHLSVPDDSPDPFCNS